MIINLLLGSMRMYLITNEAITITIKLGIQFPSQALVFILLS